MFLRFSSTVGFVSVLLFLACSSKSSEPGAITTPDAAAPDGGRYSFSPLTASRACVEDSDCTILPALANCMRCCGGGSVAKGQAERDYQAAVDACQQSGKGMGDCGMACGTSHPACVRNTCVAIGDGPPLDLPDSGSCAKVDVAANPTLPALGSGPGCGATAVTTGFENGLDPSWVANDPSAFEVDRTSPITGGASLEVWYLQKNAYLTIAEPSACGVRIAFTIRTHLQASGITLARIVEGAGSWLHVRLDGCTLSVAEETRTAEAAGVGFGGALATIPDDTPVRVVLTVDLRSKTLTSTAAPLGQPLPAPKSTALRGDPSGAGAISAIELGCAPGIQSGGIGSVSIDDLTID